MELRQHRLRSLSLCITICRVRSFSLWGLFSLTDLHRWTEHTGFLLSHRFTQMNRTHRVQWRWWPLPRPLPRREGAWSPRYPYGLDVSSFLLLISFYISCNALWSLYADGLLWARNVCQKGSVRSVSSVRKKTFTKYASSPVGVTSHTTPLPAGEGLGEGPLSCGLETCAKMLC